MTRVIVLPEARDDLREARRWLRREASESVALGLRDDFSTILHRIAEFPRSFPRYPDTADVRFAVFERFRYTLYFQYEPKSDRAAVLALLHHARDPAVLGSRF